jgi:hypothetical protein
MSKNTDMSDVLSRLEAERAIRQTVIMMTRAFDDEHWETVRACVSDDFTGSAVVQTGQPGTMRGADAMLTVMKDLAAQRQAAGTKYMHMLGEMIVTLNGDEAQVSAFHTAYLYPAGEVSSPSSKSGSRGTYSLRRESGAWKFVSMDVDRLWLEGEPY